jgi:SAM-dependent methyltransferase
MNQDKNSGSVQYWNSFYSSEAARRLAIPSQFAAFIAGELQGGEFIAELGCGTGRDALFFSSIGYPVIAFDASDQAIAHCTQAATRRGLSARFECASVGSPHLHPLLHEAVSTASADEVFIYTRFFLHAITEEVEDELLDLIAHLGVKRRLRFAAEFRTHRDTALPKTTSSHYRRFIDPTCLLSKVSRRGFAVDYFVEGFGYAKYKDDDAHVARLVISR